MSNIKKLFEKLGDVLGDLDTVKIAVTLEMLLNLLDFIRETYADFDTNEELTVEQQQALYDKYDEFYDSQKAVMKAKIAAGLAKQAEDAKE